MTPYDDPDTVRTLACLLRMRPASMAELRAVRQLPVERLDDIVAALAAAGYVTVEDDDRLTVHDPEDALLQQVATAAASAELLPSLLREARAGAARTGELAAEVVHGHQAQWEAWARWAQERPPRAPVNLYPDLEVLREVVLPDLPAMLAAHPITPRAVVPAAAVVTPEDRAVVEALVEAGMDVRIAATVESWVYADPGVLCAVPLVWAEHPPTSIMIIVDPAVTAVVSAYVETLWAQARPYVAPRAEWDDILPLLWLGMSDAAIASASQTSLRTVQRRIAGAMEHYGVASRFELGVAWGASSGVTISGREG